MKNRIREVREAKHLSQHDLAIKIGATQNAVYNWESGKRNLKYETLTRIADALGCQVSDLVDDAPRTETMSDAEIKYTVDHMLPMTVSERNRLMDKIKVVNDLLEIGTQMTGTTGHCIEVDKIAMKILFEAIEDAKKLCQELPFVG